MNHAKGGEILENHVHDEDLIGSLPETINTIGERRNHACEYAECCQCRDTGKDNCGVALLKDVTGEKHPKSDEDTGNGHENKAEFGFAVEHTLSARLMDSARKSQ
jgi:hypothetical protein